MTREETNVKFAIEMHGAQSIDDDGSAMLAVLNRYLDEAEIRGHNDGERLQRRIRQLEKALSETLDHAEHAKKIIEQEGIAEDDIEDETTFLEAQRAILKELW